MGGKQAALPAMQMILNIGMNGMNGMSSNDGMHEDSATRRWRREGQ